MRSRCRWNVRKSKANEQINKMQKMQNKKKVFQWLFVHAAVWHSVYPSACIQLEPLARKINAHVFVSLSGRLNDHNFMFNVILVTVLNAPFAKQSGFFEIACTLNLSNDM